MNDQTLILDQASRAALARLLRFYADERECYVDPFVAEMETLADLAGDPTYAIGGPLSRRSLTGCGPPKRRQTLARLRSPRGSSSPTRSSAVTSRSDSLSRPGLIDEAAEHTGWYVTEPVAALPVEYRVQPDLAVDDRGRDR